MPRALLSRGQKNLPPKCYSILTIALLDSHHGVTRCPRATPTQQIVDIAIVPVRVRSAVRGEFFPPDESHQVSLHYKSHIRAVPRFLWHVSRDYWNAAASLMTKMHEQRDRKTQATAQIDLLLVTADSTRHDCVRNLCCLLTQKMR